MMLSIEDIRDLYNKFEELVNAESTKEDISSVNTEPVYEEAEDNDAIENNFQITKDILMGDPDLFVLNNHVGDIITTDTIYLNFAHEDHGMYSPGITEKQLLTVLLYRYKDDKERYNLIKRLLV